MDKSLNVIICTLNSKYVHSSLAPWCLMAGITKWCNKGILAEVLEGTINEKPETFLQKIIERKPDVIGFSCYIWNITAIINLVKLVKQHLPKTIVVLGGPEVSYNSGQVLSTHPYIDYIISGEGEKPFALFLNELYKGEPPYNIPGVSYRLDSEIKQSPPYVTDEQPPSPYTNKYFEVLNKRIAYLETSRGCPYSCAFCLSGREASVSYFDIERAKKELILLANSGTKTVKLVDRTFNAHKKRAAELIDFIISKYGTEIPNGVCFHFEIAGDILDFSLINLLGTAQKGAIQLEIGLQSFNTKTLEAINRKTDLNKLTQNISRLVANANIHIHIDLIAGLPFEDLNSFASSFNTAYNLKPHMLQLGFLKLIHGSPMRENRDQFPCHFSELPPYEVISTPWLSEDELKLLHDTEDALDRLYNSGRFRRTLDYILSQSGITPFELYCNFGKHCSSIKISNISLDDYTAVVYNYFSRWDKIDKTILRDIMVCDRLSTNSTGSIPPVLEVKDEKLNLELKTVLKKMRLNKNTAPLRGVRRGAAILCSERCIVYADYKNQNPVTGDFVLKKYYIE
jgi:radical SAM superfamily enzyme YgiQ (UPF0313 family)